MFFQSTWQSKC